jgi:uncharacterized protein involved in exopolysaccharide biosynthesis
MASTSLQDEEISFFELLSALAKRVVLIVSFLALGVFVAGSVVLTSDRNYVARATFTTQGGGAPSGLAGLAGQLGLVGGGGTGGSYSADFYISLMRSPVLLSMVVEDTIRAVEFGEKPMTITEILKITAEDSVDRAEAAMGAVQEMLKVKRQPNTGLVEISVASPWAGVSVELVGALLRAVNRHNREVRRTQVTSEREFIEDRMIAARLELREAEDALQRHLAVNRDVSPASPTAFERDRLSRTVELKQQVFLTLATSFEDVRIREVRESPYFTVVEPARLPRAPERLNFKSFTIAGAIIGFVVGVLVALVDVIVRRAAAERPQEVRELRATFRSAVLVPLRLLRLSR